MMVETVTAFLTQHAFILLLAFILPLAGFGMAVWASREFARFRGDLRTVEETARAVSVPARSGPQFNAMADVFRRTPALRGAWAGIESTLVRPADAGGAVVATIRPSEFLSADLLRQANINVGLFQAVPGYLVGTGLLFTFSSLLLALMAASGTMSATSAEATHDALQGLLSAAAMKFVSSIAGLLSSIVYSIWLRHRLHHVEAEVDRFGHELDRRIPVQHPIQAIAATNGLLLRQVSLLDAIDRQWREELVGTLVSGTNEALRQGLEPLVDGMNRMADRVGELSVASMERMVGEFTRRLEDSMREHTHRLIDDLKLLKSGFGDLLHTVKSINGNLAQTIEAGSAALDRQVGSAAAHLGDALHRGGAGLIQGLQESRDVLAKTTAEASERMEGRLADTADRVAARLKESVANLETELGSIDKSFQVASATMARDLSAATERIVGDIERVSSSFRTADEGTAQALPAFLLSLDGLIGKIGAIDRPMEQLARDIERSTRSLGKAADASARTINQSQAAVERISAAAEGIAGMQDSFTALGQAVRQMETLDTTVRAVSALSERLSGLDRTFATVDATMQRLAALEAAFSGLAEAGVAFTRIQPPLEALVTSGERMASLAPPMTVLGEAVQGMARNSSSLAALSGVFERALAFGEAADRLTAAVDRIADMEPLLRTILEAADPPARKASALVEFSPPAVITPA